MTRRATLRRRLAWTVLLVLLCSVVASLRLRHSAAPGAPAVSCAAAQDSAVLARFAADTVGRLRDRRQQVTRFTPRSDDIEVRTEDIDPLAPHNGGLVAFDCEGRLTFLWLDGG